MTRDEMRRVCEHAEDGVDVLRLGIQPEDVLRLLDTIEGLLEAVMVLEDNNA